MKSKPYSSMRGSNGPIRNLDHLCTILDVERRVLDRVLAMPGSQRYALARSRAAKSDGSAREVFNPCREVRRIQLKIVKRILKVPGAVRWHDFLYGSMPNQIDAHGNELKKDYVTCAAQHCDARSVLKIDIKDFFGNIHSDTIMRIWTELFGYPGDVAFVLTNLCLKDDNLPQGGITSSYLAMLCLFDLEAKTVATLRLKGLRYTRYVDDITISSPLSNYDFELALALVRAMLISRALPINESKVKRVSLSTEAITVHGLRVNFETPRLPAAEVGRIRASVKTIELLAADTSFSSTPGFRKSFNKCMGRVNKLKRVGHSQHSKLLKRLQAVRPLPSRRDIKKAVASIRTLSAEFHSRGNTFGYRKRYYILMERLNLIARSHKELAAMLRAHVKRIKPSYVD
ncbi:reverse transcriptase family protein [Luteimonas sp. 9C]|uniref:reverse transcriptase family protein n=1 Tax=Luteimonas sp. 9C TaxID=2653148 RepID=UPI001358408E|nr:reverse transcriptase family protein [Luteimonas sp. 9C]